MATKIRTKKKGPLLGALPENDEQYQIMADELIVWAEKEDSININDFSLHYRIDPLEFRQITQKSSYFSRAFNLALALIGSRRERLAQEGKLNQRMVLASMPLYDPKYREWLLHLKHMPEEETKPKTFNVYLGDPSVGEPSLIAAYEVPSRN